MYTCRYSDMRASHSLSQGHKNPTLGQHLAETHPCLQEFDGGRRQEVEKVKNCSGNVALLAGLPRMSHRQQLVRLQPLLQVVYQLLPCAPRVTLIL